MKPIKRLQIGKNGLSQEFVQQVKQIFENEQLIKISILKSARKNKADAQKIGDDLVDALGKNYLYKLIGYVLVVRKYRKDIR